MRDFAQVNEAPVVTRQVALGALEMLGGADDAEIIPHDAANFGRVMGDDNHFIRGMGIAAIEDVQAIDARGRLRAAWRGDKQCRERGEGEACELHDGSSLGSAQYARSGPAPASKDRERTRAFP